VEVMAKTVALEWGSFFEGNIKAKGREPEPSKPVKFLMLTGVGMATAAAVHATAMASPLIIAVPLANVLDPSAVASASIAGSAMKHAFAPLIQVIQTLSYPVSFIGMAAGMLLISVGQRHKGIQMIKWAAIGYVGMQLVPGIMDLVSQVGQSIQASTP
jgi:hypothetical protein